MKAEARASRLEQAMLRMSTSLSNHGDPLEGFWPWSDTVRFVFQKDHLGCQGAMEL